MPLVQLAMIQSPFSLSVDRPLPVPSKSQPDEKALRSFNAGDLEPVDKLALAFLLMVYTRKLDLTRPFRQRTAAHS